MKYLFIFILLHLFSPIFGTPIFQQIEKMESHFLQRILVFSQVKDLNQEISTSFEKLLWLKMYKIPNLEHNTCFSESHGICKYDYCFTISELDDFPKYQVRCTKNLGEITSIEWLPNKKLDQVILKIKVNLFSKQALQYNSKLNSKPKHYLIELSIYEFNIKPI